MWKIFASLTEAQAYCDAATAALPRNPGDVTAAWDVPRALTDGRYVVAAIGADGEQWRADWVLPQAGPLP